MEVKFSLFRNKKTKDTQPDYRGDSIDKAHEVSCWIRQDKNGNDYLACTLKPKREAPPKPVAPTPDLPHDSDLPF
jgi:uncharacterized protein (DUF736 family)